MVENDSSPACSDEAACRHYWDIQPPKGYVSEGTCRYCGAIKEFHNSNTYEAWTVASKRRTQS